MRSLERPRQTQTIQTLEVTMSLPARGPYFPGYSNDALEKAVEIECYGLCTECIGSIIVDARFDLRGAEASCSFYLIPLDPLEDVPYTIAAFYADCIAFEHELPVLALPIVEALTNSDIPWNFAPQGFDVDDGRNPRYSYVDYLRYGAEIAGDITNGCWGYPIFRYDRYSSQKELQLTEDGDVQVEWTAKYYGVSLALHLYNAALRQADPLSKYLCYYRVIENVTESNGKAWIEEQLDGFSGHEPEPVWYRANKQAGVPQGLVPFLRSEHCFGDENRVNVVEVMRGHALLHLSRLKESLSVTKISERLYNENRCGIAHGRNIKSHDLGDDFASILNDLKIIRFLARLSISHACTLMRR